MANNLEYYPISNVTVNSGSFEDLFSGEGSVAITRQTYNAGLSFKLSESADIDFSDIYTITFITTSINVDNCGYYNANNSFVVIPSSSISYANNIVTITNLQIPSDAIRVFLGCNASSVTFSNFAIYDSSNNNITTVSESPVEDTGLSTTNMAGAYIGSDEVDKIYLGTEVIYEKEAPGPVETNLLEITNNDLDLLLNSGNNIYTSSNDYSVEPSVSSRGLAIYDGSNITISNFKDTQSWRSDDYSKSFNNTAFTPTYENVNFTTQFSSNDTTTTSIELFDDNTSLGIFTRNAPYSISFGYTDSYGGITCNNAIFSIKSGYMNGSYHVTPGEQVFSPTSSSIQSQVYLTSNSTCPRRSFSICPQGTGMRGGGKNYAGYMKMFDYVDFIVPEPNKEYSIYLAPYVSTINDSLAAIDVMGTTANDKVYIADGNGNVLYTCFNSAYGNSGYRCYNGNTYLKMTSDSNSKIRLIIGIDGTFRPDNIFPSSYLNRSPWNWNSNETTVTGKNSATPRLENSTPWVNKYISITASRDIYKFSESDYNDNINIRLRTIDDLSTLMYNDYGYITCDSNKNITSNGIIKNENYGITN